ncbi:MAG: aminotransferase class III-fold pyridoxal phosphate-dependent enzyme, partial [Burkholderiaceae bacterium]
TTLAIFDEDDVIVKNQQRTQQIADALVPIAHHPRVRHVRQQGMIAAFDVEPAVADGFSRRFFTQALEHELLLRPIGKTVYWMPPYIASADELDWLGKTTLQVLDSVAN